MRRDSHTRVPSSTGPSTPILCPGFYQPYHCNSLCPLYFSMNFPSGSIRLDSKKSSILPCVHYNSILTHKSSKTFCPQILFPAQKIKGKETRNIHYHMLSSPLTFTCESCISPCVNTKTHVFKEF